MKTTDKTTDFCRLISDAFSKSAIRKIVFSKPEDKGDAEILKVAGRLAEHRGQKLLAMEYTLRGDTVAQRNLRKPEEVAEVSERLISAFSQVNLLTSLGDAELRENKSGEIVALGAEKLAKKLNGTAAEELAGIEAALETLDRQKARLLDGSEDFLIRLGVSDERGRVHDKKQGKFRQINRFLEYLDEIYPELPEDGTIKVFDLCCGKSYLSFAVYYFLTERKGRRVEMLGMDLKRDVIAFCEGEAAALGYTGLRFIAGDIRTAKNYGTPDLVISLHACDIATDIVLDTAIALGAKVILSTPCCHRALNGKVTAKALSFVTEHPQLAGKLNDALTDGLRLLRLRANGYEVSATELVDPEDTPKNTLLRAIRRKPHDEEAKKRYEGALDFLLGDRKNEYLSLFEAQDM